MNRLRLFSISTLLVCIAVIHLYKIGSIPPGLSNDEANIGYEAWSIATTGKDQWGHVLPIAFEGFGNWSLPVYIYTLTPFIFAFGPTAVAVRLLSLVAAVVLSGCSYALVRELHETRNNWLALLAAAFVGFTPWIFGLSRTANEVTLATTFFVAGLALFLRSQKRKSTIMASAVLWGLAMLTYYGMWVFVPLFLVATGYAGRKKISIQRNDVLKGVAVMTVLCGLLFLVSIQQGGNRRLSQVNIFNNIALVGTLNEKRGACVEAQLRVLCQLFFNKPAMFAVTYFSNYISHFSFQEWFITNSAPGILPPGGFFLLLQAPLLLVGIFTLFRVGSRKERFIFFSWLLLSPIADSATSAGNFTRSFMVAPVVAIVSAYSFLVFPRIVQLFIFGFFFLSISSFILIYISLFPKESSLYTHYEYQPLIASLKNEALPIYISSRYRDTKQYMFLLFYGRIFPQDFQQSATVVREREADGWIWVRQVNNWHFEKSIPHIDTLPQDAILVGATKEEIDPFLKQYGTCDGLQLTKRQQIDYLNHDPAFSVIKVKKTGPLVCPNLNI